VVGAAIWLVGVVAQSPVPARRRFLRAERAPPGGHDVCQASHDRSKIYSSTVQIRLYDPQNRTCAWTRTSLVPTGKTFFCPRCVDIITWVSSSWYSGHDYTVLLLVSLLSQCVVDGMRVQACGGLPEV
jgi:hypothetical protein